MVIQQFRNFSYLAHLLHEEYKKFCEDSDEKHLIHNRQAYIIPPNVINEILLLYTYSFLMFGFNNDANGVYREIALTQQSLTCAFMLAPSKYTCPPLS